jgi:hypothetical protein
MPPRRVLGEISRNIRRPEYELSPATRGEIIECKLTGQSHAEITVSSNLPCSTIASI